MRQRLPYLLGDERHERVDKLEYLGQDIEQHLLRAELALLVLAVEAGLGQLDIPVAVAVPDEVVYLARGDAQLVTVHILADLFDKVVELGKDPLVLYLKLFGQLVFVNREVHHHEAGRVPELVAEVAHRFALLDVEAHIVAGGVAGDEVVAQCVRAVLLYHLQRVDAVAEGLGHLASLTVAHEAVDEHGLERLLVHLLHAGEYHSRNPEEDDIIAGYHNGGRVPVVKLLGLFRPAHRGERPERRAEPCVQNVLVAGDVLAVAALALRRILAGDGDVAAVGAVPRGYLMTPPELAGDAPVVDVLHPVKIGLGEAFGDELYSAVLDDVYRFLCQRLHLHEPLRGQHRLDDLAAAVAAADVVTVRLDLDEVALLLQTGDDGLARLVAIHSVVLAAVYDLAVLVDALYLLKVMAQADLIVVGVVAGGHLDGAGAEAKLNVIVGDDGELAADKREYRVLADEVLILLVRGVDGDAAVAQHGFGAGGSDDELLVGAFDGISDVPEVAGDVLILDLRVGKRGAAVRAPVYHAASLVNESLLVQITEGLADGLGAGLVHGEAAAIPVAGYAHALLLLYDTVAVLLLPLPDALKELFAAEVIAGLALLLAEHFLDLYLRCDARVVDAGQPQRGVALHTLIAGHNVLKRGVQRVSHMELAGDIGGRHDDGEGLLVGVYYALEIAALHPHVVDLLLNRFRFIHFRKFFHFFDPLLKIFKYSHYLRSCRTFLRHMRRSPPRCRC